VQRRKSKDQLKCRVSSLFLRKENRILNIILEVREYIKYGLRKLHSEEADNVYSSPNIIPLIK
jgi:hypothetical protein